jgi:hypothetical protein
VTVKFNLIDNTAANGLVTKFSIHGVGEVGEYGLVFSKKQAKYLNSIA